MGNVVKRGKVLAGLIVVLLLGACTAQFRNHGYVPTDQDLTQIIVGSDTRETVAEQLGRPSTEGILDDSGWYYVESRYRIWAYQEPREIERQVVAITYDRAGRVSNVERFGLEGGRIVNLSRRVTDSSTAKVPFLRRLLGNLGAAGAGLFN